jgi:hypothetical protein
MASKRSSKSRRHISAEQLKYLEYLIWKSRNADDFSKKCLIWLIRQSQGLTRQVRIVDMSIAGKVCHGFHDMCSENGTTHIDALFGLIGSEMRVDAGGGAIRFSYLSGRPQTGAACLSPSFDEISAIVPANPYKS